MSLVLSFVSVFKNYAFLTDTEKQNKFVAFEAQTAGIVHSFCRCCCSVRLVPVKKTGVCVKCSLLPSPTYYHDKACLPVWWERGNPRFALPRCLSDLTHAEKMVIQRISPFVPLMHIKLGVFGLSGHCVAFEQNIDEFVSVLPRKRDDVSFLKVLQIRVLIL